MAATAEQRERLDRLQGELATRRSTTFFARGAITLLIGLIISGAGAKLLHDSIERFGEVLAYGVLGLAGLFALYSFSQFLRGRAVLKTELSRLQELQQLRRELKLDDPSSLLPSR